MLSSAAVMSTGKQLLEAAHKELKEDPQDRRRRKHLHVNMERWDTMASHAQEVAHALITSKGE